MALFDPAMITAAILAGGEGVRLGGRDKGLELLCNEPLVAHVVNALAGQAGQLLICANRNQDRYAQFAPVCDDAIAGFRGPLAGIAAALSRCGTPWLLTVPVDCPQPPADLARRLHAACDAVQAAFAHDGERRQPLFALYSRALAGTAADALARNSPVWQWHDEINAAKVDFSVAHEAFANLNTVEEFRNWELAHGG